MSAATFLHRLYMSWYSKPAADRPLYRTMSQFGPVKIVEIGIGSAERTTRVLRFARRLAGEQGVEYTGMDLFDARESATESSSLKVVHRMLKATGVSVRLIPGSPYAALSQWSNSLSNVDLLLIGDPFGDESLEDAWFFVPRMLHAQSRIFRQSTNSAGELAWQGIPLVEVHRHKGQRLHQKAA